MKQVMSHLLHVHPWQYGELTRREFDGYVATAKEYLREARRARQAAR